MFKHKPKQQKPRSAITLHQKRALRTIQKPLAQLHNAVNPHTPEQFNQSITSQQSIPTSSTTHPIHRSLSPFSTPHHPFLPTHQSTLNQQASQTSPHAQSSLLASLAKTSVPRQSPFHTSSASFATPKRNRSFNVVLTPDSSFLDSTHKASKKQHTSSQSHSNPSHNPRSKHADGDAKHRSSKDGQKKQSSKHTHSNYNKDSPSRGSNQWSYNTPQGKRNNNFIFNNKVSQMHEVDQKKRLRVTGGSPQPSNGGLLHGGPDQQSKSGNIIKPNNSNGKTPNHPLGLHHQTLSQRKEREQQILAKFETFQAEINQYQAQLTQPLQDLILTQFPTIQRMALSSKDSKSSEKYSKASKKGNIQILENIGGGFHAIEDETREFAHNKVHIDSQGRIVGVKPEINALLEGNIDKQGYLKKVAKNDKTEAAFNGNVNVNVDVNDGWSLPSVDGVSKRATDIYSSRPQIDPKSLPIYLQQVIFTADKQLLAAGRDKLKMLGNSDGLVQNAQKLLTSGEPGVYQGSDANGKVITIEKTADHRLLIHGLLDDNDNDDGDEQRVEDTNKGSKGKKGTLVKIDPKVQKNSISIKFDQKSGEVMEVVSLKDNLPLKDAFLPPMVSMAPPSELLHGGGIEDDTLLSVSISTKTLVKQFEKKHLEAHKKEYFHLIDKHGQKEGTKIFWQKFPLNQRKLLPRESDIHAKYMSAIRGQHDLLKEAITATGYGHIQQVESREAIISSLLETANDDHELLLLLKQSNVVNDDILDLSDITLRDPTQDGIVLKGKDALHGVVAHHDSQKGLTYHNKQYLDENSWLNSKESIVLPYSSPDGYSDAHLPSLLRTAVKSLETTFNQMKTQCTPSATAYTNMMTLYGQLGLPARAATLFDEMMHDSDTVPDTTTYNVMLNILSKDGKTDLCLNLFDQMRQQAIDVVAHGKYPALPPKHVEARKLHKLRTLIAQKARAMGIDDVDFSGLVEMVKNDPTLKGTYLQGFDEKNKPSQDVIPRPDVITYTTVIKALGKAKHKTAALKLFQQMRTKDQITPNELTWTTVIDIACDNNDFLAGLRLFHEMKQSGIKPSRATYSAMTTSAARGGEIALTTALLHEMMLQQQKNISLYGNSTNHLLIDAHFLGSIMRASAEGGNASYSLKLHSQLLRGQLTGSGSMIGGGRYGKHDQKSDNKLPNAITYNALMEVLADPASWGRSSLPPAALRIGLAVYQEAVLNKVFPHPYSEVQSTGVLDLRPYNRGAVLFPIHFYLNSLLGEVPVYAIDGTVSNIQNAATGTTTTGLDMTVASITNRKAPSQVVGQSPYSVVAKDQHDDDEDLTAQGNNTTKPFESPQEVIKFPHLTVPPKGVVFVSNKEVKPVWSAQPTVASVKFQQQQQQQKEQKYLPSVEYIENVLKHTKPWLHFSRLHYGAKGSENTGGATTKKKTANNPNAVVVTANALRLWVHEQNANNNTTTTTTTNPKS